MTEATNECRVLLVDDEADFLEAVRPGLMRRGMLVAVARSGQTALNLLESGSYDVVVLDVRMPGIDGVDTFRIIKNTRPEMPVIILTGHGNIDQAFETSREGVYEYLTKPCDVGRLANVIWEACEESRIAAASSELADEAISVLVVDDDRDFVSAITSPLQRRGVNVTAAHNSRDALRYVLEKEIHVALVDVVMPGVDGITLLHQLRKADPLVEVIILTGHPSVADVRRSFQDGAFDFLTKPQPVKELLRRIREAHKKRESAARGRAQEQVEDILSERPD